MTNSKLVYPYQFVTAIHGTEFMPTLALASLGIPQIVANPFALSQRKRFIDSDLNAAFGKKVQDYETRRAAELLPLIADDVPVIDFHSFTAPSPTLAIIVDPAMLSLAKRTGIKRIVYMKFSTKDGHALINHRYGVSVETGQNGTKESFDTTLAVVDALQGGTVLKEQDYQLFEVYGKITEDREYRNFELDKDGDEEFYPILWGENDLGLKARRVESFAA